MKKVAVIMGSDSDLNQMQKCIDCLKELEIPFEAHIMSAHRTPERASEFSKNAKENGFGVIIAAAGMAAHLAGAMAANTVLPVVGIPLNASPLNGMDALLSTVQMPPGLPVACVSVDGARNAAILAAQILALGDEVLYEKLLGLREDMKRSIAEKDKKLCESL
jgi:5-(carboxyamino)imidazole ribonucleotide mutase